jgi:hypothetical protein
MAISASDIRGLFFGGMEEEGLNNLMLLKF